MTTSRQPSLDPSSRARRRLRRRRGRTVEGDAAELRAIGALLAAAEAVGAAGRMLDDARAYAAERRQFGRTIGSFQSLRHILADMYVARERVVDGALRGRLAR